MSMTNPLARVRGLGSAKDGTHHWIVQRMTAVALIPLTLWFVVSLISLIGSDLVAVQSWLSSPFNAVMMILTLVAGFHHAQLGLQVDRGLHPWAWKENCCPLGNEGRRNLLRGSFCLFCN